MEILKYHILAFITGYVLDLIVGDPHSLPHPIRLIGRLISFIEKRSYKDRKAPGLFLVITVLSAVVFSNLIILFISYSFNTYLGLVIESILTFYCLATKSLADESGAVLKGLDEGGIDKARKSLSMIVGRDTDSLSEGEVLKACVETVAENTSDGVVAPLIYLALGGPVLGMFYKAANTMDSMVGYKNDRYSNYGFFAAKLDDVLNYFPSRISAILIIVAAFIFSIFDKKNYSGVNAFRIWKRDRYNHKSPNSAQSESAYAGALGLKLAGGAFYFGKYVEKPYIGDELRTIEKDDLKRSHKLLYLTSILCEVICTAAIYIVMK